MTGDAPKTDMPERDLVAIALRDPAGGKTRLRDTLSGRQTEALSWALFDRLIVELSAARPACVDLAVISGHHRGERCGAGGTGRGHRAALSLDDEPAQ